MKTLVIYHTTTSLPKFLVTEEDTFNEFDNVFINLAEDEDKAEALSKLLYDTYGGLRQTWLEEFPLKQQPFDKIINIGFFE